MAPRRLWGWEPTERTAFQYDEQGRMVGSVTRREPEFDSEQVGLLLAHLALERDKGPHGIPLSRATAPDAKFVAAPVPTHDKAAKALAKAQAAYYKQWPDADRSGDLWSVEEVTD